MCNSSRSLDRKDSEKDRRLTEETHAAQSAKCQSQNPTQHFGNHLIL